MKKMTPAQQLRNFRKSSYAEKVKAKKHALKWARRRQATRVKRSCGKVTIVTPSEIRFQGDEHVRNTFTRFVSEVEAQLGKGRLVKLDFRKTQLLHPCGLLLLLSHVDDWVEAFKDKISAIYPSDEVVEQMLQSVGILQKLGLAARTDVTREEVTRWFYFTGVSADATSTVPFMDAAAKLLGYADQSALYDCIAEAITNVTQHAYSVAENRRWWMFASIHERYLIVAIMDSGKSIPGTLWEKPGVADFVAHWAWGRKRRDSRMLHAAMGGKSRTKLPYRGQGLPEMLEATKAMTGSSLTIYSRRGIFYCDSLTGREERGVLDKQIEGTLLLWSINAPEVLNDVRN